MGKGARTAVPDNMEDGNRETRITNRSIVCLIVKVTTNQLFSIILKTSPLVIMLKINAAFRFVHARGKEKCAIESSFFLSKFGFYGFKAILIRSFLLYRSKRILTV